MIKLYKKSPIILLFLFAISLLWHPMQPCAQSRLSNKKYDEHLLKLKKRIPGPGFTIVFQKPFFVIGNQKKRIVENVWAKGTVKWAVDKLKDLYFDKDPERIIDVWLFKDKHSYVKYTQIIWGSRPSTPYGYYSRTHNALVMNIGTGGGTLVHEIVHPFVEANFKDCPDWFNEGLGSLYEQSSEKNGRIMGLTNWRLAGLQSAILKNELPGFYKLTRIDGFYSLGHGYAQSRYLCYYLQKKGLLVKFYKDFVLNVKRDPSGYLTLKKVLEVKDMRKFQKSWEKWVMKLKFPPST